MTDVAALLRENIRLTSALLRQETDFHLAAARGIHARKHRHGYLGMECEPFEKCQSEFCVSIREAADRTYAILDDQDQGEGSA